MPKYLRTSQITAEVESMIRGAKERLYIISPYLRLSDNIKELLSDKEREKLEVRIIFGKQELNPDEMTFLQKLKYVRLFFSKNLHAKCYLNENTMVIASMNLYEFSQQNNREMGILVDRNEDCDRKVYEDAWADIQSILNNATDFAYVKAPGTVTSSLKLEMNKQQQSFQGYCIRTGTAIPFNTERPLSYDAFKSWSRYNDPEYAEKYCHFSGELSNGETTVSRPILKKNWKKAKEVFGF